MSLDLEAVFESFTEPIGEDCESHKFDRIEHKLNRRPDLHAFLLLDSLLPDTCDMVTAAEHDVIYLHTDPEQLAAVATEDNIRDLVRCGVFYDTEFDSLAMFV